MATYMLIVENVDLRDMSGKTVEELVEIIGEAAYGDRWQAAFAHELDISPSQLSKIIHRKQGQRLTPKMRARIEALIPSQIEDLHLSMALITAAFEEIKRRGPDGKRPSVNDV